jgi:EmrB/QacA subfamily drug resistance transporter
LDRLSSTLLKEPPAAFAAIFEDRPSVAAWKTLPSWSSLVSLCAAAADALPLTNTFVTNMFGGSKMSVEAKVPDGVVPAAKSPGSLSPYLWALLAVVLLADVLDLMDSTITTIAAPSIVSDIGGGESLVKWLGAGYALAMGVLLVVGGRLGDRFGRRRMFLIGTAGFTLASLACGVAGDPAMLIAGRIVQGGFGAMMIPQGIGILTTALSKEQLPTAFSAFGPIMGGSAILGPILAGFIVDLDIAGLAWRPIFLINIVLGTASFFAATKLLPADEPDPDEVIDGRGAGLLGAAMVSLLYGLISGSSDGWTALPIGCIGLGAVLFGAFALRQKSAAAPLINPSLLRDRGFTSGLLVGLFYFATVNGLAYVTSLFLQLALGRTPSQAAIGLAPMMLGIIIASFIARPAIAAIGRRLVFIGLSLTVVAAAGLWATVHFGGTDISQWSLAPSLFVLGLGMGACFGSIYDIALGDISAKEAGSASGALSAVQQLATAIGSALVTTVYFGQIGHGGEAHAMAITVAAVGVIALACLGPALLLPRRVNPALEDPLA